MLLTIHDANLQKVAFVDKKIVSRTRLIIITILGQETCQQGP